MTATLVPALRLMRDGLRVSRQLEVRECLTTVAMGSVELESQTMARNWSSRLVVLTAPGVASGYPEVLVEVESSDAASAGGIPGRLAVVRATAFEDRNGNSRWDSDESSVSFATKIAKFASYSYEGRGS